jgi:hypothetical protein
VADLFGGGSSSSSSSGSGFNLSSLTNAISSAFTGMGGTASNAASTIGSAAGDAASAVNPVSTANAAENTFDPTGSIGAQLSIDPPTAGSVADQQSGVGGTQSDPQQGAKQQNNQYAPESAVAGLKDALDQLTQQQRQNPWAPQPAPKGMDRASRMPVPPSVGQPAPVLPQLSGGDVGAADASNLAAAGKIPTLAAMTPAPEASDQSLPGVTPGETGAQSPGSFYGTSVQPQTAGPVAEPAAARLPPEQGGPPSTTAGRPTPKTDDQGRAITVKAKPTDKPAPGDAPTPDATTPTPTKGGPTPEPTFPPDPNQPSPSPMMRDVTGGQSVPPALVQLARAALPVVLPMLLSAALSRKGGGFRHFGGFHPGGGGHWPYHHPMQGWQMHDHHPGGGWRPMDPRHMRHLGYGGGREWEQGDVHPGGALIMQALFGNGPQGIATQPAAARPGGYPPGMRNTQPADTTEYDPANVPMGSTERGTPGVSASQYDSFARNYASQIGLNPDVVSRVLATESSFGQNIYGDYVDGKPTSFGGFQLHLSPDGTAMGNQYMRQYGHAPWDHKYWQEQVKFALDQMKKGGLGPWKTTMNKLGYGQWSANAAPTRTASAPPPTTQQGPEAAAAPG